MSDEQLDAYELLETQYKQWRGENFKQVGRNKFEVNGKTFSASELRSKFIKAKFEAYRDSGGMER